MTRRSLFLVLFLLSFPLIAVPRRRPSEQLPQQAPAWVASAEEPLPGAPIGDSFDFTYQNAPRLAAGAGGQTLVVWGHNRAARLDAAGQPLDATPIALPSSFAEPSQPLWDAGGYLVFTSRGGTLVQSRIGADGSVLAERDIEVTDETITEVATALVNRTVLVAAVEQLRTGGNQLELLALDLDGNLLRRTVIGTIAGRPRLATGGSGALLLLNDLASHATGVMIAPTGAAGAPFTIGGQDPDGVWTGSEYFVVTADATGVSSTRIDAAGHRSAAFPIHSSQWGSTRTAVAGTASGPVVAWLERTSEATPYNYVSYDLMAARAGADGSVTATGAIAKSVAFIGHYINGLHDIGLTASGPDAVLAWAPTQLTYQSDSPMLALRLAPGDALDPATGSRARNLMRRREDQYGPQLASDNGVDAAAWLEQSRLAPDVVMKFRSLPDGEPKTIHQAVGAWDLHLASNGLDFVAAWKEGTRILAERVAADGTVLDPNPIVVVDDDTQLLTSIFCSDGTCAFGLAAGSPAVSSIRRLGADGSLLDAAPITLGGGIINAMAAAGFDWTAVLSGDVYANGGVVREVRMVRLHDGAAREITSFPVPVGSFAAAWNGEEWMLLLPHPATSALDVALLGSDGNFFAYRALTTVPVPIHSMVWDGRYFVALRDESSRLIRISPDGYLRDGKYSDPGHDAGVPNETITGIAVSGDGQLLVGLTRRDQAPPYWDASRGFVKRLDEP